MSRAALLVVAVVLLGGCGVQPPGPSGTAPEIGMTPPPAASVARSYPGIGAERLAGRQPASRPQAPEIDARFRTAPVDDHCVDRDLAATPATDVTLTVLDRSYALAPGYAPPDLVPASGAGFEGASGARLVRAIIIDDLAALRAAMADEGLAIIIESGYRSWAAQQATFELWAGRLGYDGALLRSARAGHSEHQLGTALDVTSAAWGNRVGDWALDTPEGAWMAEHAWEYGFVMSYPSGSVDDPCFGYEPWHYRWVGRGVAARHRDSGLTLRDFLVRYVAP